MTVVKFPQPERPLLGWKAGEVQEIVGACAESLTSGEASGWDTGNTEAGDPQFYLLGPLPDRDCILCISRLGRLYVLEDGSGKVLFESGSLARLTQEIRTALRRKKAEIVGRVALIWCGIREAFEENLEPMLAEPAELLTQLAPQLAALA